MLPLLAFYRRVAGAFFYFITALFSGFLEDHALYRDLKESVPRRILSEVMAEWWFDRW